jgi:hypothetical protein
MSRYGFFMAALTSSHARPNVVPVRATHVAMPTSGATRRHAARQYGTAHAFGS